MNEYKAMVKWENGRRTGKLEVDVSEEAKLIGGAYEWISFDITYEEPFSENPFFTLKNRERKIRFKCPCCGETYDYDVDEG